MPKQSISKALRIKVSLLLIALLTASLISIFVVESRLLAALVVLVTGLIGIGLTFLFLSPLEKLIFALKNISSGNIGVKVEIHTGDEIEDISNVVNQMVLSVKQIVDKVEEEKAILFAQSSKLNLILSSMDDGIIAVDLHKNILFANIAAQKITGFSLQEMLNKPIDTFIKVFSKKEEILSKMYCPINFSEQPLQPFTSDQSLKLVGKEGRQANILFTGLPISGSLHSNLGCILVLHDLTQENELEQMKLDFVSMASHELRTPLTSIIGYLKVFIDENRTKITAEELNLLEKSLASAQRLYTLVINLLNVNKIERERLVITPEPLDWEATLKKAAEDLQNQAKQKNIILTLIPSPTPIPKVMADPMRIVEVVNNLVSNAINYTKAGGKVTVSTQVTPNEVITTVEDTGIGMSPEAVAKLFTKFFRASSTLDPNYKHGTGLGLYISKSVIDHLKGKIWVESELGKGSKFHFSLPLISSSDNQIFKVSIESHLQNPMITPSPQQAPPTVH